MSEKSVLLLLTEDYDEAAEISSQLCVDNSERQEIERDILEKIDGIIRRKPSLVNDKIIVIDGENWHQGVIGLIAAKVKEAYGKPAIVADTHFIRITGRLGLTKSKDPVQVEKDLRPLIPPERSSDFCHRVVWFGRDTCRARKPQCKGCPMAAFCPSRSE